MDPVLDVKQVVEVISFLDVGNIALLADMTESQRELSRSSRQESKGVKRSPIGVGR